SGGVRVTVCANRFAAPESVYCAKLDALAHDVGRLRRALGNRIDRSAAYWLREVIGHVEGERDLGGEVAGRGVWGEDVLVSLHDGHADHARPERLSAVHAGQQERRQRRRQLRELRPGRDVVDALLKQSTSIESHAKRLAVYQKMLQQIGKDAAYIPL